MLFIRNFYRAMAKFIEPIIEEEFYCLTAPDGSLQVSSLAPDLPMCMGFVKLLHKSGIGMSWHELKRKGFTYEKVKLTVIAGGKIKAEA